MTPTTQLEIVGTEKEKTSIGTGWLKKAKELLDLPLNQTSRDTAYQTAKDIKLDREEEVVKHYEPMKKKAKAAHQEICDQENSDLKPIDEALVLLRDFCGKCDTEISRVARVEQERLLAQQKKDAETAALEAAAEAEKGGEVEKAEAILAQPVIVVPVASAPKAKGSGTEWVIDRFDKKAFVLQLAATPEPFLSQMLSMVEVSDTQLKRFCNATKSSNPFAGIWAKEIPKTTFR